MSRRPRSKSRREPGFKLDTGAPKTQAPVDRDGQVAPGHQGGTFATAPTIPRDRRRAFGFRA